MMFLHLCCHRITKLSPGSHKVTILMYISRFSLIEGAFKRLYYNVCEHEQGCPYTLSFYLITVFALFTASAAGSAHAHTAYPASVCIILILSFECSGRAKF